MKVVKAVRVVAINVISFLILLAVVNWACGLYLQRVSKVNREDLPNYKSDPSYAKKIFHDYNSVQHVYEPFVGWKMQPYKGETLTVGKDGKRLYSSPGTDVPKEKSIHFFGGSTMWGEGADDANTIPALFQEQHPNVEVVNHGQLAYNSRQELDALISYYATAAKRPDIVVFYDGVNDAAFLCPKEIKELPAHRLVPMYRDKLYTGSSAVVKELAGKLFLGNILKVVHRATNTPDPANSPYDCVSNPAKAETIAEMMMRNWEMAQEIVTNRGGTFYAILQPAAFIGSPNTAHLTLDEDLGKNFQAVYAQIKKKISERNHDWIIDLSDRFNGNEQIYIDFCHVSPNGNQIIADALSKAIVTKENVLTDVTLSSIHP